MGFWIARRWEVGRNKWEQNENLYFHQIMDIRISNKENIFSKIQQVFLLTFWLNRLNRGTVPRIR